GGVYEEDFHESGTTVKYIAAMTSYLGVVGKTINGNNAGPDPTVDGVFVDYQNVKITDITDGLSSTVMVGERPPSPDQQWGRWYEIQFNSSLWAVVDWPWAQLTDSRNDGTGNPCPQRAYFSPGELDNFCDV